MELLIGCGKDLTKKIWVNDKTEWDKLVTLDHNKDHNPDVVHDLEKHPLPFDDNTFDEVHAYGVLEHIGQQGDWRSFFDLFSELHRILKKDGFLMAMVPSHLSIHSWGDPSHKRVINQGTLPFLSQDAYRQQVGKTMMSDFRFYYKADLPCIWSQDDGELLTFILQAIKDGDGWTSNPTSAA